MRRQVHNLILAFGCGLILFGFAPWAEAGFIVTSLDSLQTGTTAFTEVIGSFASSPVEQPQTPQQFGENLAKQLFWPG